MNWCSSPCRPVRSMLPHSSMKTTAGFPSIWSPTRMRSEQGRLRKRSGTGSLLTITDCLPMASRASISASSDPSASPSGRTCDVITNLSRERMISRIRSNILGELLVFRLDLVQKFFDSKALFDRFVVFEDKLWNPFQVLEALAERMADITRGRLQTLHRPLVFLFGSQRRDEDSSVAEVT